MAFHVEPLDKERGVERSARASSMRPRRGGEMLYAEQGAVQIANKQYNTCTHPCELVFDRMCQVDPVEDGSRIETLKLSIQSIRSAQARTLPCSVDFCVSSSRQRSRLLGLSLRMEDPW